MTKTALALAALDRISRERPFTDAEVIEVKRLAHLERQCKRRRERYATDPVYRQAMIDKYVAWRRQA